MRTRGLTDRQEKFAVAVSEGHSYSEAFRRAGYAHEHYDGVKINKVSFAVASRPAVVKRITELSARKRNVAHRDFDMTVRKLLTTYIQIAFTDPNELISVRAGACRHCWGTGGAFQWKEREYREALEAWQAQHDAWSSASDRKRGPEPKIPDCSGGYGYRYTRDPNPMCEECEGEGVERTVPKDTTKLSEGAAHLYRGVHKTKDGIKILFADKDKALESIGRILGAFDDRLQVELKGTVASLQLTTSDPAEAARAYERMITGQG